MHQVGNQYIVNSWWTVRKALSYFWKVGSSGWTFFFRNTHIYVETHTFMLRHTHLCWDTPIYLLTPEIFLGNWMFSDQIGINYWEKVYILLVILMYLFILLALFSFRSLKNFSCLSRNGNIYLIALQDIDIYRRRIKL